MLRVQSDKHAQEEPFRGHPTGGALKLQTWAYLLEELELGESIEPRRSDKHPQELGVATDRRQRYAFQALMDRTRKFQPVRHIPKLRPGLGGCLYAL